MPMFWEDYALDTEHLSAIEHGAYLMLISYYWRTGRPLPDDDLLLSRVSRTTPEEWRTIKATVCRFFYFEDGFWRHKRIELELDNARALSTKKRAAANKRWRPDDHVVIQMPDRNR
jgi:uncharacterized protein YdaU (DUF1376 family)